MTIAEFERAIASKRRMILNEAKERAAYDYILGDLIGKSIGRIYSSATKYPDISQAYPSLFNSEDLAQARMEKQAELSALRFKQYANFHNKKYKEEVANKQ
jgi:hypothetical protein